MSFGLGLSRRRYARNRGRGNDCSTSGSSQQGLGIALANPAVFLNDLDLEVSREPRFAGALRDYGCPDFRRAFREVERVESRLGWQVRFAFRHFPTPDIHPHAVAAASAAEAAAL